MTDVVGKVRNLALVGVVALVSGLALSPPSAATRSPGTVAPTAGTGIGTAAALANPLCDKSAGPDGTLNFIIEGGGPTPSVAPVCTAVWTKGTNNGGATYQGVTKDSIKVVVLVPNDQQTAAVTITPQLPINNATGQPGTVSDVLKDAIVPYQHFFQTYGRKIDLEFVVSSGDDETAQRADAVKVISMKPFMVADATYTAHAVFEGQVAGAKIVTYGAGATFEATQKQAPYRWGGSDTTATAQNLAEFLGKQLVNKLAEYAGDGSLQTKPRKFGLVSIQSVIDQGQFDAALSKYHVTIDPSATIEYQAGASATTVDPTTAQEEAPVAITKLKAAGVTSVILFADNTMIPPLLQQATDQDYHPEWIITSYAFADFPLLSRSYDQGQWAHAFGLANLPLTPSITATAAVNDVVQWYWGFGKGTSASLKALLFHWMMRAIMYAGPHLTPQTVRQGWFSVPASGGARNDDPYTLQTGYGRTPGLPYDVYQDTGQDYSLEWWDPTTMGPAIGILPGGQGTMWFLDGSKRYSAGQWPTKSLTFFDKTVPGQITLLTGEPQPVPAPCRGCPSETGRGHPPGG